MKFLCIIVRGHVVSSLIVIQGYVEVKFGTYGLGCPKARFWVVVCMYDGAPILFWKEGDLVKKIFN